MRLSSLNPVSILFGPIFQKEVRTSGRRRGTYILRALYVLGLLGLVALSFEGMRSEAGVYSGVQRLQTLQRLAPDLALVIVWFQFVAMMLAAPIFTGPCICDEKRARTLSALLTTMMTAAQIVYGKLSSRIVQLLILGLMAAPLLLAVRVFGGLDAGVVIAATGISLSTAVLGAALGLMYSTWHKRATSAAVFAILTLILVQSAPSVVEGILFYWFNDIGTGASSGNGSYPFHINVLATCAPATLGMISAQLARGGELPVVSFQSDWLAGPGGVVVLGPTWVVNTVYNLLAALAVTLYTTGALRRTMLKDAATEGGAASAPGKRKRRRSKAAAPLAPPVADATEASAEPEPATPEPAGHPGNERERESREVGDNPVLWREVRQATFGSRRRFAVIAGAALAGLVFLYWRVGLYEEGLHMALAVVGALAVMIQPVFMTTGSIAGEREARTWEVLLTTPLRAHRILLGKLVGSLRSQWFLPTLVLLHFLFAAVTGHAVPLLIVHLLLIFAGPVLLFTASGQLFSLLFRKSTTAAVCNLLLALALWLGTWIALGMSGWYLDAAPDGLMDDLSTALYVLNPVALAMSATDGAIHRVRGLGMNASYLIHGTQEHRLGMLRFTLTTAAVFAAYAIGAFYAFALAAMLFPRLGGRAWSGRQQAEEGMAAAARIITSLLAVVLGAGMGYVIGGLPGLATGLVAALGLLLYWAVRRRQAAEAAPASAG